MIDLVLRHVLAVEQARHARRLARPTRVLHRVDARAPAPRPRGSRADELRQSSVAMTSPRLTLAPGRTSTVSTYADTICGPIFACTHGSTVPT